MHVLLKMGALWQSMPPEMTTLRYREGGGGLNVTIMMMCITCMMSWLSLVPRDFIVRYQCVGKISRRFVDIFSTHWYLRTKFLRQQHLGKVIYIYNQERMRLINQERMSRLLMHSWLISPIYSKGSNQSHQSLCSWLISLINLLI